MQTQTGIAVSGGVFTAQLDFGAAAFSGAVRYLEVRLKLSSEANYTTLAPRQLITSTPYSIRSLSADTANTANNANQLGGTAAGDFVQTNDSRLSDARTPTAGSNFYIQNTTTAQTADFNITGNGTAGGNYTLDQSVIASGGGQNAAGGGYTLDGTIGQSIAGTTSSNSPFTVKSGFWADAPLAPTAASVSVGGRILTADGAGLLNARVVLTDASGNTRTVQTTSFGYYRFDEVAVGETYIISIVSRRYQFATQVIFVSDELTALDFTALALK